MPPSLLVDLRQIDRNAVCMGKEQIYALLPHRHEFMVLDGVCHLDLENATIIGFADIQSTAWWCPGHVPGRPLLPGVLMLEMAGQLSALLAKASGKFDGFIAYGGVDNCKFREPVIPPARLHIVSKCTELRPRRIISMTQGMVEDRLIFEATVTGMILR